MIALEGGGYRLSIDPLRGGSIARFDWQGAPLMRPACGPSVLGTACFPLVPFSNRIAHGRFAAEGREVRLTPNMPGSDHPHPLHGFGWLAEWHVIEQDGASATIEHVWPGGEWPWRYQARQHFQLGEDGLLVTLDVTNLDEEPMPAGLGLHPYFPRTPEARYHGLHRGEWRNDADCLPVSLDGRDAAIDWWDGRPVGDRWVDTVYAGREGVLQIDWPERGLELTITPSDGLPHTVVYAPKGGDFFCIEPVSHATDAFNRGELGLLAPGDTRRVSIQFSARRLS